MGFGTIRCVPGFPTASGSVLTDRLEGHALAMDVSYRESQLHWLIALSILHDAVDAALADEVSEAARHRANGQARLAACNHQLTQLGHALVELRCDLFDRGADAAEPLLAREPHFATLDYDALYRELAAERAVLPQRAFWDETAARVRDGGARGGFRLLERHLRELQSDLQIFTADVEKAGRLPLRAMAEALHGASLAVSRVMTGYTRLITTCGYVSVFCERALLAYEHAEAVPTTLPALATA